MDLVSWGSVFKSLVFWGPGAVIAALMILALYQITMKVGLKFIDAQKAQAEALASQAQSMEGLRLSIEGFVGRDNTEHREMLVLLRYIAQQQNAFEEVRIEHNERKEQAHPHCPIKSS